jgi:hypothetical protein
VVCAGVVAALDDRWSVRLDVSEDEIERLYAQGLTRGALVWKDGMAGWRPLLNTQQLASRLLHTRITLNDASDAALEDEVTLPRPARLPSEVAHAASVDEIRDVPTVAPTELDVAIPSAPRRRGELVLVAALAFGLAWFGRGSPEAPPSGPVAAVTAASRVPAPSAPAAAPACPAEPSANIPTVALADLPVLGAGTFVPFRAATQATTRTSSVRRSSSEGPSRQELVAALGRVASVASGCGDRDGAVRVVITFANSGVARSIQVSGQGLPSPVRSCIIGAASRARVASFAGEPVTVSKSL